ncbi:multiprotein-bridging factor 1 [Cryptotrichosporon argae]
MSGWDDKPQVIGYGTRRTGTQAKGNALATAQRVGAISDIGAKERSQAKGPADHQRIAKLDRDDAPKPPEKVDSSVGKALATARMNKKTADGKSMTQKELATAVNAKPQDIAELESGKAVPNQQLLAKLERVVGVKLRGAASTIGQPLGGPKKK